MHTPSEGVVKCEEIGGSGKSTGENPETDEGHRKGQTRWI